jgi:hypothetical protein
MTLETLPLAGSVAALAVGVCVFASPHDAQTMTPSGTDAVVVAQAPATRQAADDRAIRPFTAHVPQAALDDLRRRLAATRWAARARSEGHQAPAGRGRRRVTRAGSPACPMPCGHEGGGLQARDRESQAW